MIPDGPLFEVAVVRHTGCGTGFLADASFRSAFAARTGLGAAMLAAEAVVDPAVTVRTNVDRLLSSPKVPPQISVSGHVYDLQTGLVTTTADPAQPHAQGPSADAPDTAAVPQLTGAPARGSRTGTRAGQGYQAGWPTPDAPARRQGPRPTRTGESLRVAAGTLARTEPPGIGRPWSSPGDEQILTACNDCKAAPWPEADCLA